MSQIEKISIWSKLLSSLADRLIMGRVLALSVLTLSFMFVFQNCNSFESQPVAELSSQCRAQLKSKAINRGGWTTNECEKPSHYKCALKVYNPMVARASYQDIECFETDGLQTCFNIDVETFDTSGLLDNPAVLDEAFVEGGDLNRMEYRCSHLGIIEYGHPVIVEVADTLERAFVKTQQTCKQGVKL